MKMLVVFLVSLHSLFAVAPKEAFDRLMEGNKHYMEDNLRELDRGSYRRDELVLTQKPFAVIVGCADSRVPPEIIFDQGLGDLFVVRVAGPVVGAVEIGSIDYAVKVLGARLIFVLGHESCGAVTAVLTGNTGDIEEIADLMKPALKGIKPTEVEAGVKANVLWTIDSLKKTSYIKKMMKEGKIGIVGGYYSLSDGHIEILKKDL